MRLLTFILLVACSAGWAQEMSAKGILDAFTARWKGEFKVYTHDGRLLDRIQVEQNYWWEGEVQHARFIEHQRDGRIVHARARNYERDGQLYCEVEKNTGEKTVHTGHYEDGALFWFHQSPDGATLESFKERVVRTESGREYRIDGFGVYGTGKNASYLHFEGRYKEVKENQRD